MTKRLQCSVPERAVSAPWSTRLSTLLGRLLVPTNSWSRARRARLQSLRYTLGVLPVCLLLLTTSVRAGEKPSLPEGVPNLLDPEVRAQYEPSFMGNLLANPDFPLVLLVNRTGTHPGAILVALDARNGTDTWSLGDDPIVLIALFVDPATITDVYIDRGLLEQGTPSGSFQNVPDPRMLPDLLHALSELPARTFL